MKGDNGARFVSSIMKTVREKKETSNGSSESRHKATVTLTMVRREHPSTFTEFICCYKFVNLEEKHRRACRDLRICRDSQFSFLLSPLAHCPGGHNLVALEMVLSL
ncbi:hypothetical protein RRG08_031964 [Elysia crispata]|uniref:Uncharacterized protein n=1 Tax=Elysia crispata TaxID=231223 RepID=A0AAE0Z420_9GAST|nr:hypothetical protein RRG08_031964 [Elysia crispata]